MNEQELADHLREYRRGIWLLARMIERNSMNTKTVARNSETGIKLEVQNEKANG
jgi:hypothetical protein